MTQTQPVHGEPVQTQPIHGEPVQTQPADHGRTRAYRWADPAPTAAALTGRSGIDVLRAMLAGELPGPPIMATLEIAADTFEVGRAVFSLTPSEMHYNPLATVHGGVLATLLDSAAACAVHSVLPVGSGYTSVDLTTTFLRPVTVASGRITAEGRVLNRGRRTALAQAQLTDERGRLLAHATSTCLIFELPRGD